MGKNKKLSQCPKLLRQQRGEEGGGIEEREYFQGDKKDDKHQVGDTKKGPK